MKINLIFFFFCKTRKLSNIFFFNNVRSRSEDINDRHHVAGHLQLSWICTLKLTLVTTCTSGDRFRKHTQQYSSMKRKQLIAAHSINRATSVHLVKDIKILSSASNKRDLIFLEALLFDRT